MVPLTPMIQNYELPTSSHLARNFPALLVSSPSVSVSNNIVKQFFAFRWSRTGQSWHTLRCGSGSSRCAPCRLCAASDRAGLHYVVAWCDGPLLSSNSWIEGQRLFSTPSTKGRMEDICHLGTTQVRPLAELSWRACCTASEMQLRRPAWAVLSVGMLDLCRSVRRTV
ncbi:hypothetical protein VFPBJ_09734 [Purpureocillium lilacinum]|uniref:Uncharacterized protein n=1 Tax=Purpureocillium lilacinum TaxID=33203 RepID=A0A179GA89_PURLI|nr:hypothetical protein VFPBJ_09734 [Purpureocillium lilacinum]